MPVIRRTRGCRAYWLFLGALLAPPLAGAETGDGLADAARRGDIALVRQLLRQDADPNLPGDFDTPALHWLARRGDAEGLQLLLEAGADPNQSSRYGVSALELAVSHGHAALVEQLLRAGADPETRARSGESVLMLAAGRGVQASVAQLLARGAEVDARDPHFGQTALMFAARGGHAPVVALLLAHGADPDAATAIGETPPWIGPNSVPGFGFGEGIIRGGVPADRGRREPIPGGMTPLLYAARHDHREVAALLLDAGADIDKAEANAITPLLMAISNDQLDSAHLLLARGAAVNRADWYGRTPLWEAVNVRNLYLHNTTFQNYIDRPPWLDMIRALLDAGAEVNTRTRETPPFRHHMLPITGSLEWVDFTGQTPFLTAALAGDLTVMNMLLDSGADPHIPTFEGTTALMAAAGVNWVLAQTFTEGPEQLLAAVKLCHALGMDVNQRNSMGLTALHGAANRGSNDIIRFLAEQGARLDVPDKEGRTPLDWARGVFLATHPAEPKPESIALLTALLEGRRQEAGQ